jgi:hypothetical protein
MAVAVQVHNQVHQIVQAVVQAVVVWVLIQVLTVQQVQQIQAVAVVHHLVMRVALMLVMQVELVLSSLIQVWSQHQPRARQQFQERFIHSQVAEASLSDGKLCRDY